MTDEEYKINEEPRMGHNGLDGISLGAIGVRGILMRAMDMEDDVRIKDKSEIPSMKMKHITTVNYMFGKLMVAKEILDDVDDYNPHMEEYLGMNAKNEYEDAIHCARRAVREALELLSKEVKEQNKVLDPWKEEEE